jgi:putative transposase
VRRAPDWRFASLWVRLHGDDSQRAVLSAWPVPIPADWLSRVNAPIPGKEHERMRISMARSRPFGDDAWVRRTARRVGLMHTLRSEGRPPKAWCRKLGKTT